MQYKDFTLDFTLENKVAAITGAASGIGLSIAQCFAQKGAQLFLIDRSDEVKNVASQLQKDHNIKAVGINIDLTEQNVANKLADECVCEFGRVDILVNNAGLSFLNKAEELSLEHWNKTINLNLTVPFLMSQSFAKKMIAQGGGKIINMASQAGVVALDTHVAYCASKAGIISLTQVCALEWGKHNITVNCISPTVILTPMGLSYWVGERAENMLKEIPVGRFGYPKEVAAACVYLASDAGNLFSGSNLIIDGGYTIK